MAKQACEERKEGSKKGVKTEAKFLNDEDSPPGQRHW